MCEKNRVLLLILLALVIINFPGVSYAAGMFEPLKNAGRTIFEGLRQIIYPASAVGIIAVCIGGFFGNINWKWLTAIILGLVVITLCVQFVAMFAPSDAADEIGERLSIGA